MQKTTTQWERAVKMNVLRRTVNLEICLDANSSNSTSTEEKWDVHLNILLVVSTLVAWYFSAVES